MKEKRIIFWIASILIFLFEGLMPLISFLFAPQYATAGTEPLGYPDYFAYALVICKVLGATALVIPKLQPTIKEWAYAGLTFSLVFAFISHAAVDKNIGNMVMPLVIVAILAVSYIYNRKIKANE